MQIGANTTTQDGKGFHLSRFTLLSLLLVFFCGGCTTEGERPEDREDGVTLVFKHGKIEGDPAFFRGLLDRFEATHPGIRVVSESLPASTDQQHQFYVINLEGKSDAFDLMALDVIWLSEFSRAGWTREVGHLFTDEEAEDFFPGTMDAVTHRGKRYAIPWYIDAGLLYYRKDLLEKYGFKPPTEWKDLVTIAQTILQKEGDPRLVGFVWQGKQYEGLICNVMEYIWSRGGAVIDEGRVVLEDPAAKEALRFMRGLIGTDHVSPPLVTTADEEVTRRIFGEGRAIFMRNWPYAWNLFQSEGSKVREKVGIVPLPSFSGHSPAATLGGWHLGINRYARHPQAAEALIRYLTSPAVQKSLAIRIGYNPTRMSLYHDPELRVANPPTASLYEIFLTARPRPVTPYYLMFSQIMQPEFSAALTGIKSPEAALQSAQRQMAHIIK
ncbi:MAG: ABC transporter substrate-binding protein [Nitrospiria bacterium]